MKILMLGIPGLLSKSGGDRIQIEQTAAELKKLDVDVTIAEGIPADLSSFDVIHVFQLDWNPYCYFQIRKARSCKKPVVFSPIHHSVKELKRFDDEFVFDFRRISKVLFKNQFHRDLFKEFYKSLFKPSKMWIVVFSAFFGLKKMYKLAIEQSDVILVQTEAEAKDLRDTFGVDFKWRIVKNGVAESFCSGASASRLPANITFDNYLLSVGRIEPRKNQTTIIQAVKKLRDETGFDLHLVLIGLRSTKKHYEYYQLFDKLLKENSWVSYIPKVPYDQMSLYYQHAKVGVSASWFETTGLTSLEALFCGTNAVASGERAREYLKDFAYYCDPGDLNSIKEAILAAYLAPRPVLPEGMRTEYTWKHAAEMTLAVYQNLVNIK